MSTHPFEKGVIKSKYSLKFNQWSIFMQFEKWLLVVHGKKQTPMGDLARDYKEYISNRLPFHEGIEDERLTLKLLVSLGACYEAKQTFKAAHRKWEKWRAGNELPATTGLPEAQDTRTNPGD